MDEFFFLYTLYSCIVCLHFGFTYLVNVGPGEKNMIPGLICGKYSLFAK